MIMDIIGNVSPNFTLAPDDKRLEIYQNVYCIISTLKGSVPLNRSFGLSGTFIDDPMPVAAAKLREEITEQIAEWEPRAKVVSIDFEENEFEGKMTPKVKIEVVE